MAFYANGTASFEHQDWLGTERLRTTYNGGVEGTYQSLPWGDGQSFSGSDQDAHHYATLDYDSESNTDHAQFRQYSSTEGRFLSPDPYGGSYNPANPQSFNRYEYAMDNPLSNIDPSGLDQCTWYDETGGCNGPYSFWFQMQVGAGGGATTIIMNDGACLMDESLCQMAYQNMFENNQLQFPVVSSGGGGGGGGGGAPNNGSNAKQVWACRADAAINYGLGFIPGYNAAKLAFTIAGGNVNFVQNYISGKSIVTFDNPFTGMGNVKGMFWGANALASTYNTIMQAAKTVGPGAVLDDVAKAAGTAGTVANLVNTASAINDVIACGSVHN